MYSFWDSIKYIRCCHVMQSLFPRFISARMFLNTWVPYSDPCFRPRREEVPETMSI